MRGAGRIGEDRAGAAEVPRTAIAVCRILGVDPGSTCTGYGLIAGKGEAFSYLDSGTIRARRGDSRYQRLRGVYAGIRDVIERHHPTHFAIEGVFYSKNPRSALVLGEARGVAILAACLAEIPVFEYSAREVKQSVTGNGAADKSQVSYMLGQILKLDKLPARLDESDAIAIAMCHAFKRQDWSRA